MFLFCWGSFLVLFLGVFWATLGENADTCGILQVEIFAFEPGDSITLYRGKEQGEGLSLKQLGLC